MASAFTVGKKVLFVGNSVVDCINVINTFPVEDSKQEMKHFYWQRGGNATNSSTVSTILSLPCEYFGVLATKGPEASWMINDFAEAGICTDHCVKEPIHCIVATSLLNQATGSRTIIYCLRDYRFVTFADFNSKFGKDFDTYAWIHFELLPNVDDILAMMRHVSAYNDKCRPEGKPPAILSVEIEGADSLHYDTLMSLADFVFISKEFALRHGSSCAVEAVDKMYKFCKPGSVLICPWGEDGAALRMNDTRVAVPARCEVKVIDSLGAGDTFNAAFISYMFKTGQPHQLCEKDLELALCYACDLAGYKCSIFGFSGLTSYKPIVND